MKKLIVLSAIAACLAFSEVKAQTVNGVRLSEIRAEYIEISEFRRYLGEKTFIYLEYGQKIEFARANAVIKDDDGKDLEFNSLIDCVNKLRNYGYELFETYVLKYNEGNPVKYYILKKK
ncbi:MAG: hypothetical protein V4546_12710 [Bacteroidota bacterium]|uniref:Uncharacterized protein n=1 Tax=Pedobacter cryotolerans TaxID=2571270 RepID=A0A4U1C8W4_9SPHI|nr:hypothetical protein [Pedobacter cryotolerans]TKC02045.1 hypothetical protein FA045_07320 [Pedobacter cryotolerans]